MAGCAARGLSGRYALGALRSRGGTSEVWAAPESTAAAKPRASAPKAGVSRRPTRQPMPADPTAYAGRPDSL